ncbi:MAG TPA: N-acetyltransferase [Polyangiaceae bacterium]|nr:N-acetyltransferase [Polyangiaceae bacterium]
MPSSVSELLARVPGVRLTPAADELDTTGLDFVVARAVDDAGAPWIVRAPRHEGAALAATAEARVLEVVARLPVAVPSWRVHAPDVIAYPLVPGTPAVTLGPTPSWNVIDPHALPPAFLDSFAAMVAACWALPDAELAGLRRQSIADARAEAARDVDLACPALAPPADVERRWRRWLADDGLWPDREALVHGDLHPGHLLLDDGGALVGVIDWSEAKVSDPSIDLALFFGSFGPGALRDLLARLPPIVPREALARHAEERWCAFPSAIAAWGLRNGNDAVLAHARGLLERQRRLRDFEPGDLPALQRVRQAAFAPVFRSFEAIVGPAIAGVALAGQDDEQARLLATICAGGHHVWVLTANDAVAGFVTFTADPAKRVGEIGLNAVHPDHAGRGLGAWMYGRVLARLRELGCEVATVGTGGDASHAPARRAYAKAGFGPTIPSVYAYAWLGPLTAD